MVGVHGVKVQQNVLGAMGKSKEAIIYPIEGCYNCFFDLSDFKYQNAELDRAYRQSKLRL
jgi:hypothetical protein